MGRVVDRKATVRLSRVNSARPAAGAGTHRVERVDRLGPADEAAVQQLVTAATAHDGFAPLNEHALLHLRHPDPDASWHLLGRASDDLAGYVYLDVSARGPVQAECVVAPAHRDVGWGRALMTTALGLTAPRPLQLWAHGDSPAAAKLATSLGFIRVRELLQLRRPLDAALPALPQVAGVHIRTFRPGDDDAAWLALNARAFADHPEQGAMTQRDLDQRLSEPWFDPAGFFLAERDGRLVGFHWTKVHGDAKGRGDHGHGLMGEVYVIGVDPQAQGGGLGRLLTLTGLQHLRDRGLDCVLLYVESDNTAAVSVYGRLGFERVATDVLYRIR